MPSGNPSGDAWRTQATRPMSSSSPAPGTSRRSVTSVPISSGADDSRKMPPLDRFTEYAMRNAPCVRNETSSFAGRRDSRR